MTHKKRKIKNVGHKPGVVAHTCNPSIQPQAEQFSETLSQMKSKKRTRNVTQNEVKALDSIPRTTTTKTKGQLTQFLQPAMGTGRKKTEGPFEGNSWREPMLTWNV